MNETCCSKCNCSLTTAQTTCTLVVDQISDCSRTSHLFLLDPGCWRRRPWNMSRPVFSLSLRLCPPAASSAQPDPPFQHRTKEKFSSAFPPPDHTATPPSPHYKQTTRQGFGGWRGRQDTPDLNGNMCVVGGEEWCRGLVSKWSKRLRTNTGFSEWSGNQAPVKRNNWKMNEN